MSNAPKGALKAIDKPSTSFKSDLSALAKVVAGINKGASNETFAFEFRSAISNYVAALVVTNDALAAAVADANNNPKLKAKAAGLLEAAQTALAGIQPENNLVSMIALPVFSPSQTPASPRIL